ncbi:hypothetical protein ACFL96_18180 [Thermoproteota archaeon]
MRKGRDVNNYLILLYMIKNFFSQKLVRILFIFLIAGVTHLNLYNASELEAGDIEGVFQEIISARQAASVSKYDVETTIINEASGDQCTENYTVYETGNRRLLVFSNNKIILERDGLETTFYNNYLIEDQAQQFEDPGPQFIYQLYKNKQIRFYYFSTENDQTVLKGRFGSLSIELTINHCYGGITSMVVRTKFQQEIMCFTQEFELKNNSYRIAAQTIREKRQLPGSDYGYFITKKSFIYPEQNFQTQDEMFTRRYVFENLLEKDTE